MNEEQMSTVIVPSFPDTPNESIPGRPLKKLKITYPTKGDLEGMKPDEVKVRIIDRDLGHGLISYGTIAPPGYEALQLPNGVTLFFPEELTRWQKIKKRSYTITQTLLIKPLYWCVMKILNGMIWVGAWADLVLRIPKRLRSWVIATQKSKKK